MKAARIRTSRPVWVWPTGTPVEIRTESNVHSYTWTFDCSDFDRVYPVLKSIAADHGVTIEWLDDT